MGNHFACLTNGCWQHAPQKGPIFLVWTWIVNQTPHQIISQINSSAQDEVVQID